jgi:hypothetical protein
VSTLTRPRGPLPARVYWIRRLLVLGLALALTAGIGRFLTTSSDGSSATATARQAAATPSATGSPSTGPTEATSREPGKRGKKNKNRKQAEVTPVAPTTPVLAAPTGPCASSDIIAAPVVTEAVAGGGILITLELRTRVAEACTWTVSPETLTLKITSGRDDIWSSRQCPEAVPTRDVVVRRDVGAKVGVQWSGRRSDDTCSALTEWAYPGWYHVAVAALGGEPTDLQFELVAPTPPVVTKTVTPSPDADDERKPNGGRG